MPAIQQVYDRYKDKGLEVLAVNIAETEVTVDGFVRHLDLAFPHSAGSDRDVTGCTESAPFLLRSLFRRRARWSGRCRGQMQEGQIESMVLEILAK